MVTGKQKRKFVEAVAPPPKTQTELKRRTRDLSNSDAMLAVAWLNATQGKAANRRVLAVRNELSDLAASLESLKQQRRMLKDKSLDEMTHTAELQEQFRNRHNALNQLLTRYTHVPALAYSLDSGAWRFGMIPKHPRGPEITIEDQSVIVRVNESAVIAALCRLAANRELHKVRLCEMCGEQWRISERKIDRFCGQKCRETYYASSPDYHERKAANQRRYRENLKRLQARGLA